MNSALSYSLGVTNALDEVEQVLTNGIARTLRRRAAWCSREGTPATSNRTADLVDEGKLHAEAAAIVTFNRRDFGDTPATKYLPAPPPALGEGGSRAPRQGRQNQHQPVRGNRRFRKAGGHEYGSLLR